MFNVLIVTPIPTPYSVELFDAIAVAGRCRLSVMYAAPAFPGRLWKVPKVSHHHLYLNGLTSAEADNAVMSSDLVVFSGYNSYGFGRLIAKRNRSGRPWAFWGERPGFLIPRWLGAVYRKIVFPELRHSIAPVWGIGLWAIEGYRNELGDNRLYLNVPYFSDLGPYLSIERDYGRSRSCRFLFSGSFVRRKGVDLLVETFVELVRMGSDAELHFLGDGPLKQELQAATSAIANRVHFHGFRQRGELPAFYAKADVLCAPSRYDGWGLIVPEAMAAGMPVISTFKTGSARDLVTQDCGWLIPVGDKSALLDAMMRAATLPPNERSAMSKQARQISRTQDIGVGAKQFCDAIEQSLSLWNKEKFVKRHAVRSPGSRHRR